MKRKEQSGLIWGEVKNALARQIHRLSAYCHLLIVTAHVRQAFDDSEPIPQLKEAKFYDRVWQTLHLVRYSVNVDRHATPKSLLRAPYAKPRLPAMPEELPFFSWEGVFKYAVTELELPSPEERRERIEGFLERFGELAGEFLQSQRPTSRQHLR